MSKSNMVNSGTHKNAKAHESDSHVHKVTPPQQHDTTHDTGKNNISSLPEKEMVDMLLRASSAQERSQMVMRLQQTHGNAYVQRLITSGTIQAKLNVSRPDDPYEVEADQIAETVTQAMSAPPQVQTQNEEEEEEEVQTKSTDVSRQEEEEELQMKSSDISRQEEEEELQTKPSDISRQEEEEELQMKSSDISRQEEEEELQTKPTDISRQEEEEELQAKSSDISRQEEEEELQAKSSDISRQEEEEELQTKPTDISRQEEEEELQTKPTDISRQEEEEELQMKSSAVMRSVDDEIEKGINSSLGSGSALDPDLRSNMEPKFGHDFSGVTIHTDTQANNLSRDLNAQAFTTGSDIFFGEGKYQPGSTDGQKLIAHELTHVVQQNSAPAINREESEKSNKK